MTLRVRGLGETLAQEIQELETLSFTMQRRLA